MVRALLRPWLAAIAAAVVLLATQHAFAADQCVADGPYGASMLPELGHEAETILIEGEAVPITLPVGASAIAPRTVHAIGDAVIAAGRSCETPLDGVDGWVSPEDDRERSGPPLAVDGCLATDDPAPSPPSPILLAAKRPTLAPPQGVVRTIERPPRS